MCFLRSSAVLLVVAAFAAANPVYSGNYGDNDGFGGYSGSRARSSSSSSAGFGGLNGGFLEGNYGSGSTRAVTRASSQGFNGGYGNNGFDASRGYGSGFGNNGNGFSGNGFSGASGNGLSSVSGNGFSGVSGKGFNGVGSFSSVPGVLFAFPALTSVSYSRVPQQNNDLATLAVLSALLADLDDSNNEAAAVQTVSQTYTDATARDNNQGSNVAFVPVVAVPSAAQKAQKTKIVKTTIETDGAISGLNGDLAAENGESDSFDAENDASAFNGRSYSAASASGSSSSHIY